jgi:hypothetical protein
MQKAPFSMFLSLFAAVLVLGFSSPARADDTCPSSIDCYQTPACSFGDCIGGCTCDRCNSEVNCWDAYHCNGDEDGYNSCVNQAELAYDRCLAHCSP